MKEDFKALQEALKVAYSDLATLHRNSAGSWDFKAIRDARAEIRSIESRIARATFGRMSMAL